MKKLLIFLVLLPLNLQAQPDFVSLQQSWVDSLNAGASVSSFYWEDRNLIYSANKSSSADSITHLVLSEEMTGLEDYEHFDTFRHDDQRFITVGSLSSDTDTMLLFTGWRVVDGDWKKEIDGILIRQADQLLISNDLSETIDQQREDWVTLANQHDPQSYINALYSEGATYFSNGQLSEGRAEIVERYVYMENPNYQVDLEKEKLWLVSDEQILEVGRYFTGPERIGDGGIYVILWEQIDDRWMIALDFNF